MGFAQGKSQNPSGAAGPPPWRRTTFPTGRQLAAAD
jgi:hypothetical protein